jgi:endoribonuclease Dicer
MDQISLLIFDEAHHAKKEHPFARIMRDFYITEPDKTKRPRVFGMTASPVDAKVDVIQAAKGLEELLHARIATTKSGSLAAVQSRAATEQRLVYPRLCEPFETPLYQQMWSRFSNITSQNFQRLFTQSKEASSQLGAWASDKVWEFALADEQQARKAEMSIERLYHRNKENRSVRFDWESLEHFIRLLCFEIPFRTSFPVCLRSPTDFIPHFRSRDSMLRRGFCEKPPSLSRIIASAFRRRAKRILARKSSRSMIYSTYISNVQPRANA